MNEAGVPADAQDDVLQVNEDARIRGLDAAFALAALFAVAALFFTGRIPSIPPGEPVGVAARDPVPADSS